MAPRVLWCRVGENHGRETDTVKRVHSLKDQQGATAWGWLMVLLVVVAAAAAVVYHFPPPTATKAAPAVVRGKIPPMPQDTVEKPPAADDRGSEPASARSDTGPPSPEAVRPETDEKAGPAAGSPAEQAAVAAEEGLPLQSEGGKDAPADLSPADPDTVDPQTEPVAPIADAGQAAPAGAVGAERQSSADVAPAAIPTTGVDEPAAPSGEAAVTTAEQRSAATDAAIAPQGLDISSEATASPAAEPGPYAVQTGAFRHRKNADTQAAELAWRGYPPYIVESTAGTGDPLYLVRFGRFQTRADAVSAAAAFSETARSPAVAVRNREP